MTSQGEWFAEFNAVGITSLLPHSHLCCMTKIAICCLLHLLSYTKDVEDTLSIFVHQLVLFSRHSSSSMSWSKLLLLAESCMGQSVRTGKAPFPVCLYHHRRIPCPHFHCKHHCCCRNRRRRDNLLRCLYLQPSTSVHSPYICLSVLPCVITTNCQKFSFDDVANSKITG